VIGRKDDLQVTGCEVEDVTFVSGMAPDDRSGEVKVRYRSGAVPAALSGASGPWRVDFESPQLGVAAGHSAVFYRGDEVLGGGVIAGTYRVG
jgi:tRNA-specific 2-thiouridylase